jgi:hypothetical protein
MVCFLQRQFHHRWQNHGAIFLTKIELESPRSSASVLSLNTPAVPHQIQAIILKNCSSRSYLSLFQHGHPNGWSWSTMTGKSVRWWTISNPHLLMTTPSESTPRACVQACTPLKLSSCCKYKVYYTYITESFLQQPSLHAISTLTSLFCGLIDTNMEPATQAWFKKPTLCSLSHGKEKNTSESLEIQRGLHDISILITLFLLTTLKPTMIDLPDHLHYLTYLSLSGVSTSNLQCSVFPGMVASVFLARIIRNSILFVCMNATTAYSHASQAPCVHLQVSPCPLLAKADGCTLGVTPKTHSVQHLLSWCWCKYWIYLCVWQHKTNQ